MVNTPRIVEVELGKQTLARIEAEVRRRVADALADAGVGYSRVAVEVLFMAV